MKIVYTCDIDPEMTCSACRRIRRLPAAVEDHQTTTAREMQGEKEGSHFLLRNDIFMNLWKCTKFLLVLQLLGNINFVAAKRTRLCKFHFLHN